MDILNCSPERNLWAFAEEFREETAMARVSWGQPPSAVRLCRRHCPCGSDILVRLPSPCVGSRTAVLKVRL